MVDLEKLARETLYCQRMEDSTSIVSNIAGDELEECGPTALPIIEKIVLSDVNEKISADLTVQYKTFPGTLTLMRCYFMIADRNWLYDEACYFLRNISGPTRVHAFDALHRLLYWEKPIPVEFRNLLNEFRSSKISAPELDMIKSILTRHELK